jgi:hypothetical protein
MGTTGKLLSRTARTSTLVASAATLVFGTLFVAASEASAGPQSCATTPAASTCSISGTANVQAGSLTVEAPSNLYWSGQLTGANLEVLGSTSSGGSTGNTTIEPIDGTGSGDGWNLTVTSTQFAATDTANTIPLSSSAGTSYNLSVNGNGAGAGNTTTPVQNCASGSTCTEATSNSAAVTYPVYVPAAATAPTPVSLFTADAGTGMGAIDLSTDWWLSVPANTDADTYYSTITLAINTGP